MPNKNVKDYIKDSRRYNQYFCEKLCNFIAFRFFSDYKVAESESSLFAIFVITFAMAFALFVGIAIDHFSIITQNTKSKLKDSFFYFLKLGDYCVSTETWLVYPGFNQSTRKNKRVTHTKH